MVSIWCVARPFSNNESLPEEIIIFMKKLCHLQSVYLVLIFLFEFHYKRFVRRVWPEPCAKAFILSKQLPNFTVVALNTEKIKTNSEDIVLNILDYSLH